MYKRSCDLVLRLAETPGRIWHQRVGGLRARDRFALGRVRTTETAVFPTELAESLHPIPSVVWRLTTAAASPYRM